MEDPTYPGSLLLLSTPEETTEDSPKTRHLRHRTFPLGFAVPRACTESYLSFSRKQTRGPQIAGSENPEDSSIYGNMLDLNLGSTTLLIETI